MMRTKRPGQSLVEAAIAIALMVIGVAAAASITTMTLKAAEQTQREQRAIALAEEGIEASVSIRDHSWSQLVDGNHGLAINTSPVKWVFLGGSDVTENAFTRVVNISAVDADTKKVTVTVTWQPETGRTASVVVKALLTNWALL